MNSEHKPVKPVQHQSSAMTLVGHSSLNLLPSSESDFFRWGCQMHFKVVEQPLQGRMSGHHKKICRPLDPIPVLAITPNKPDAVIPYYLLLCVVVLCDQNGNELRNLLSKKHNPVHLTGTTGTACNHLKDASKEYGYFFVFNDLGVTSPGVFRLKFQLYDIGPRPSGQQELCHVFSDTFESCDNRAF
ncbi:velvet factor-domain-containing protein [Gorgonomyces haynaldii]|nr:velvet factor-domain-containing protein [Gorgonomyces haynaldii]